jgi:hypothetical protein
LKYKRNSIIVIIVLLTIVSNLTQISAQDLLWQERDGPPRHEGITSFLKKAHLEILSATALLDNPNEAINSDTIRLMFFNSKSENVFIQVREPKRHNYWMQPLRQKWDSGWCFFTWPVTEVLQHLSPVPKLGELSAVVRLGSIDIEFSRELAPVFLYLEKQPDTIRAYRFMFRAPENADILNLTCKWYSMDVSPPAEVAQWKPLLDIIPAGKYIYIDWELKQENNFLSEGWYKMSLSAILEYPSRDDLLEEEYLFYHKSNVGGTR